MIPQFSDRDKRIHWIMQNKNLLINAKKAEIKFADSISAVPYFLLGKDAGVAKALKLEGDPNEIECELVINTTKLLDSHMDVHLDGLWNKSIKETVDNYHVKEHKFNFDGIISDDVSVKAVDFSWVDLGFNYKGSTQALVYTSNIESSDKTGMFDKYKNGKVKQHSVGMRYVKLDLAVDNKKYEAEKKVWDKYYDIIVNKEVADESGYFWAVYEAKNIEGSAVLKGSNYATPIRSVQPKGEPLEDTPNRADKKVTLSKMVSLYVPQNYINKK